MLPHPPVMSNTHKSACGEDDQDRTQPAWVRASGCSWGSASGPWSGMGMYGGGGRAPRTSPERSSETRNLEDRTVGPTTTAVMGPDLSYWSVCGRPQRPGAASVKQTGRSLKVLDSAPGRTAQHASQVPMRHGLRTEPGCPRRPEAVSESRGISAGTVPFLRRCSMLGTLRLWNHRLS